ncbi:hypothetical protein [Sphingomonas oleivorans]|nr:hypothetical protein [Sphingomonas oleivorans]
MRFSFSKRTYRNQPIATNGLNQYTQSGSIVPNYDARGNLTSAGSM